MKIKYIYILLGLLLFFSAIPLAFAGGAGGSWGCPDGWTTKADGSCSFDGGGGSFGGGGSGSPAPSNTCVSGGWYNNFGYVKGNYSSPDAICAAFASVDPFNSHQGAVIDIQNNGYGTTTANCTKNPVHTMMTKTEDCVQDEPEPEPDLPPPPDFPDVPPPNPDCNVCSQLYQLQLKINHLKNSDINNITNVVNNMQLTINEINNSITDLSVNQEITNNHLTMIDNSMGDIITNIENNNITQNEIKNEITNIYETMNDYSLQLGDIKLAMGDIDLSLKNTNKLVLDLGLDLDFIKNKLINDTSKDYTPYLNDIIGLLSPCVPTDDVPCPVPSEVGGYDDTALIALLTDMQDFMKADFVPGDDPNEVEVTDLTDIKLDRNLINFGAATCPPDNEFNTTVNGFAFSGGFKHKPLCDFFTMLAPFIKAFAGFSAALILGGGLRR